MSMKTYELKEEEWTEFSPFLIGSEEQLKLMERFFKVNVVSSPEGIAVTAEDESRTSSLFCAVCQTHLDEEKQ